MMQTRWLSRITYLYLIIPFIIFCLGWLRLFIALPIAALMLWTLWRLWSPKSPDFEQNQNIFRPILPAILLAGLWVFLSGVGGYAFQNWDHHWRNAVFHDLINYNWPVTYSAPDKGPVKMLVYYVGYWLPVVLTGKLLGWKFANSILFLWTWLGVLLVALHLGLSLKTSPLKAILLLILFSGMDALGVLLFAKGYPKLWPPITHLEIWAGDLQYSSFTTQLFWVFNQAVPAWLCIAMCLTLSRSPDREQSEGEGATKGLELHVGDSSLTSFARNDIRGQLFFLWSLCFFFAPLVTIGLLPYILIEIVKQIDIKSLFKNLRFDLLIASGVIILVSYIFFSSNSAAQERGFQAIAIKDLLTFFLVEGGILWLLLAHLKWRNPRWVVTGLLLLIIPFIQIGSGRDFVMRASIAPLFYLMVMAGEVLFQKPSPRFYRIALTILLLIGALTPLYEINRSIYRTFEYYFVLDESQRATTSPGPVTHLEQGIAPEAEHPNSLVADDIQTLKFMNDQLSKNFIANVRQSLYYLYIARH